jgi:hypothetical protein
MLIFRKTSMLAVRHVLDPEVMGTVAEVAVKDAAGAVGHIAAETATAIAGDWVRTVAGKVLRHFTDHSEKLTEAQARSNERAWKTIEIALGGQRFWDRFAAAEDRALRDRVKSFLVSTVARDDPDFLTACLKELRQARDKGHLAAGDGFRPEVLADEVGPFARFDDPEALLAAECAIVEEVAGEFRRLGYRHLGRLLDVTPTRGQPLLATAAQYYFRRAVGNDPVLARELNWARLTTIDRRVEEGFAFLAQIQERHGRALEEALEGLARVEIVVVETRDAVLDLHAAVRGLTEQFRLVHRELTDGDSVSIRDEHERALITEVKRRSRALPEDQRRRFRQLGLDVARLEVVAGDFPTALATAREAAGSLEAPRVARPEAVALGGSQIDFGNHSRVDLARHVLVALASRAHAAAVRGIHPRSRAHLRWLKGRRWIPTLLKNLEGVYEGNRLEPSAEWCDNIEGSDLSFTTVGTCFASIRENTIRSTRHYGEHPRTLEPSGIPVTGPSRRWSASISANPTR